MSDQDGSGLRKRVHYWVGRAVGDDDVSTYQVNDEIDEVAWVPFDKLHDRLDYDNDRKTLEEFTRVRKQSYPLVVLRHGRARSRKSWKRDDRERPLTRAGEFQAQRMIPQLAAYGVTRILTSSSRRCWSTIAPYSDVTGLNVEDTNDLSEEDATPELVAAHVAELLGTKEPSVLCGHRPMLPWVFQALGLEPVPLAPASLFVVHHQKRRIVAIERHDVSTRQTRH